jgi:hypothetical protein
MRAQRRRRELPSSSAWTTVPIYRFPRGARARQTTSDAMSRCPRWPSCTRSLPPRSCPEERPRRVKAPGQGSHRRWATPSRRPIRLPGSSGPTSSSGRASGCAPRSRRTVRAWSAVREGVSLPASSSGEGGELSATQPAAATPTQSAANPANAPGRANRLCKPGKPDGARGNGNAANLPAEEDAPYSG